MSKKRNINVQILLDNQKNQSASLLSAALLARRLKVQLQGLFIEDENLLLAADLTFSREVSLWSGEERHLTGGSVQRTFRSHARHLQRGLEKMAIEKKVDYSFQIIRGEKVGWIKENINTSEILFLGGHDLTSKPHQSFKYCHELTPPVVALFDGSAASNNALEIAAQLAEENNKSLLILQLVDDLSTEELQKNQLNVLLKNYSALMISVEVIAKKQVVDVLRRRKINFLILSGDTEQVQDSERFGQLIRQVHCPILLVR